jgi:hypothetical protein
MITGTALWYASRATGVVSLVLFSVVAILGIMVNRQGRLPGLPRFAVTGLHRSLSLLTVAFLGIHITTAIADGYVHIPWLSTIVPFTSGYERFWKGRVERLRDHLRRTPVRRPKLTNKEISYTVNLTGPTPVRFGRRTTAAAALDSGHEKLPGDGHEAARWRT